MKREAYARCIIECSTTCKRITCARAWDAKELHNTICTHLFSYIDDAISALGSTRKHACTIIAHERYSIPGREARDRCEVQLARPVVCSIQKLERRQWPRRTAKRQATRAGYCTVSFTGGGMPSSSSRVWVTERAVSHPCWRSIATVTP